MPTAAAFYAAVATWLALKGIPNYKLSGVMKLHKLKGLREYSAIINPDRIQDLSMEESEEFENVLRDVSEEGYVLTLKPIRLMQLVYLFDKEDNSRSESSEESDLPRLPRRFYEQPLVEIGPGAFKYESVTYPPKFLQMNLKKLLKIKEKMEAKKKELQNSDQR